MANYDLRNPLDYRFGQLSSGVTSLDTTLQSAAFANLPSGLSATLYVPITLADDSLGLYETVWVTGHAAASQSVTVVRGREGTTARAWAAGTTWRIAPTIRDTLPVYTRGALPTDAHLGMRCLLSDESIVVEKQAGGWLPTQRPFVHAGLASGFVAVGTGIITPIAAQENTHPSTYFTVANNAITIVKAGRYRISQKLLATGGSGYQAVQSVTLNSTAAGTQSNTVSNVMLWKGDLGDYGAGSTVTRRFNAGDALRLYISHSNNANSTWGNDGYQGAYLEVEMVAP